MSLFGNKTNDSVKEFEDMRDALNRARRIGENNGFEHDDSATSVREQPPAAVTSPDPAPGRNVLPTPAAPPPEASSSIVSLGSIWQGSLKIEGSVRVEGQLSGEIDARDTVHVAESAEVDAKVRAAVVVVAGKFQGQVHCRERLEILPSGRFNGELTTKSLVVHEGAFIEGQIHMTGADQAAHPLKGASFDRLTSARVKNDEAVPAGPLRELITAKS